MSGNNSTFLRGNPVLPTTTAAEHQNVTTSLFNGKRSVDTMTQDPNRSIFGETVVGTRLSDIQIQFQYNLADDDVSFSATGTAAVSQNAQRAQVESGTGVGRSLLTSKQVARYRPGHEGFAFFTAAFTQGETNSSQWVGILDDQDGFSIGYNNTTFATCRRINGSDTGAALADFNGDDVSWLDPTKLNIYAIRYGWLGIAPITYWVYNGSKLNWSLMHQVDLTNSQKNVSVANPVLPMRIDVERTAGTGSNLIVHSASWRAGIVNGNSSDVKNNRHFSTKNTKTGVGSTFTNIFTLKSQSIFKSLNNKVTSAVEILTIAADGTKPAEFELVIGATVVGQTTTGFTDIDATNSVNQVETAGATATGGRLIFTGTLGKSEGKFFNLAEFRYHWHPGENITIAARSTSGNTDITATLNWGEEF